MFKNVGNFFKNLFNFNKKVVKEEAVNKKAEIKDVAINFVTSVNKLVDDVNKLDEKVGD